MRYPAKHKESTRARILEQAGRLAKQQGFATTGVDALMAAAGLTAGGFYAHFKSKSDLLAALIEHEMRRSRAMFEAAPASKGKADGTAALAKAIGLYLSLEHVEHPQSGCPLPALSAEVARAPDDAVRETFERELLAFHRLIRDRLGSSHCHQDCDGAAWSLIAQTVGAVTLARAMHTREARRAVVRGVLRSLTESLAPRGTAG